MDGWTAQLEAANLAGMVFGWSPFNIMSHSPALHSKWLLLLKIETSLVFNFRFITNQNISEEKIFNEAQVSLYRSPDIKLEAPRSL
jgi:hypothetical protein